MAELKNGWVDYWKNRVELGGDYYGKRGKNSDAIIDKLKIIREDSVLDIGCANGGHLLDIANKTGARCYGIDISPIAVGLNKDKRLKLKVADMESTGYPDKSMSKVFSFGVFEHTPRSISVFRELSRIMKSGGKAWISFPNKYSFFHVTKNIKMLLGKWDLGYEKSFSYAEVSELLKKCGFKLEAYWVEPHIKPSNVFNKLDNLLNKINNKHFGFFINFIIVKI